MGFVQGKEKHVRLDVLKTTRSMVAEPLAPGWSDNVGVVPWNMRGSSAFWGPLESTQPRLCRPRTLGEESMEYQRDLFVESVETTKTLCRLEELRLLLAELYR